MLRSKFATVVLCLAATLPAAAFSGGAIYTTNKFGNQVNGNQYSKKTDVYLTGGPAANSGCSSGGLEDGMYYFQVTNPSGSVLLSSDYIEERKVLVSGGIVAMYLGSTHTVKPNGPCGSKLVQLAPYLDTTSNGNEYKVWMTPAEHYDFGGSGFFGFDSNFSKTDNFKVKQGQQLAQTIFRGHKFFDHSEDGIWNPQVDPLEVPIAGWLVEIYKNGVYDDTTFTDENGEYEFIRNQDGSSYTFKEFAPGGFVGDNIPGAIWVAITPREFTVTASADLVLVPDFGNVSLELKVGVGRTKGFWHNQNGADLLQPDDPAWRDALTDWHGTPLCLRRNLSSYDPYESIFAPLPLPATFTQAHDDFGDWIVGDPAWGHAGFMLSTQIAAAILNSRFGFMQFTAYIDRFENGILVPFEDMVTGARDNLLCNPGAGMTGPNDPEQTLRAQMLGCINEFGTINNSGDPSATQTVYGSTDEPQPFSSPYLKQ